MHAYTTWDSNPVLIAPTSSALATKPHPKNKETNFFCHVGVHMFHGCLPFLKARGSAEFWSNDKVSAFLVNKLCLSRLGGILNVPETCFVFV